ncbi:MAG: hypothetical protein ACLQPD_28185 [Desulfomonilaceae bacterium]
MNFQSKKNVPPTYGRLKNFLIDQNLDQRLASMAQQQQCSVSYLIRKYCTEGLDREDLKDLRA